MVYICSILRVAIHINLIYVCCFSIMIKLLVSLVNIITKYCLCTINKLFVFSSSNANDIHLDLDLDFDQLVFSSPFLWIAPYRIPSTTECWYKTNADKWHTSSYCMNYEINMNIDIKMRQVSVRWLQFKSNRSLVWKLSTTTCLIKNVLFKVRIIIVKHRWHL